MVCRVTARLYNVKVNKNENNALRDAVTHISKAFCTFKMSDVKVNTQVKFIYAHKEVTAFPLPIFTKLTNAEK